MLKLNIGAGDTEIPGFTPIDRKLGTEAYPLQYEDDSVDEIRASHVLEHLSWQEIRPALHEWHRVLRPGGRVRIAVPDYDKIQTLRAVGDKKWSRYLLGGQKDEDDFHKSIWTDTSLREEMKTAGFESVRPWFSDNTDLAAHPVSLNIEGRKPGGEEIALDADDAVDIKICGITSIPRVGFCEHFGCVVDALKPFNIPLRRYTGAYWGQHMQTVMEHVIDEGVDWLLTMDYDTLFTAKHLDTLMHELGQNPEIDAIAAMQPRRETYLPLCTVPDGEGGYRKEMEVAPTPFRVYTAHFGLTILRAESLAKVPKPWFRGTPGPDGTYSHKERIDPDIWFWHRWAEADNTVFVSPNARVGHLELLVSEYDENLQHRHVRTAEWRRANGLHIEETR